MDMQSLWRRFRQAVAGVHRSPRRRPRPPAPTLRILRLERRRVLSADFSFGASGLVLHGFDADGGETLTISQAETEYRFTLNNGDWSVAANSTPDGVRLEGQTLAIESAVVDQLVDGLTVIGDGMSPLHVTLDQADFSGLQGPLNLTGIRSINQADNSLLAFGDSSGLEINAAQTGMTIDSLNVAGDLTILSFGPITDGDGTEINVTGDATFISRAFHPAADFDADGVVGSGDYGIWAANFGLAVGATKEQGDADGDGAVGIADYTVWRNTLGQVSEPGGIILADNLTDQLTVGGKATFEAQDGPDRYDIEVGSMGTTHFGGLAVIGASVEVHEDSSSELVGVDAQSFTLISAGAITDAPGTSIEVTGLATFDAGANPITLGDDAGDTTNFGQLNITGGAVSVTEDSGTVLTDVTASSFTLTSAGAITDASTINIAGNATFIAGGPITMNENAGDVLSIGGLATFRAGAVAPFLDITIGPAGTANFGSLHLTGDDVTVQEDSATELTHVTASSLMLTSAGPITDAAGTTIGVSGLATLNAGANSINLGDNPADTTNFGQLHVTGGAVGINEDSATELTGVTAASLGLISAGPITDAPVTTISVAGLAKFTAEANPITVGNHAADRTNFGQLYVIGGAVAVTEGSGTELRGVMATTFTLSSAGPITDAAGTSISVTGLTTLSASANPIMLGDNATDTTNFGQLHLTGGAVAITEDSASVLRHVTASSLTLVSAGSITDLPGTSVSVTGLATFDAGANAITLGDDAADVTNFGQLHLTGGAVDVTEDSSTELTGVMAASLALDSAGPITDSATAVIVVDGPATLVADGKITLADLGPANSVIVGGLGSFQVTDGNDIDIGVAPATGLPAPANAQLGSLQFTAIGGMVRVALDGPIIFSGSGSDAGDAELTTTPSSNGAVVLNDLDLSGSLEVESDASITDDPLSNVQVDGLAALTARSFVTLADQGADNSFVVGDHASFHSTAGQAIDLGVVPIANPESLNRGDEADAILTLGSVSFVTDEGNVTANADNSVVLADLSFAGTAWIQSAGSLTDAFGANTTITQFAILKAAAGEDIVLGDDGGPVETEFRMDTPAPTLEVFDADRFLALEAQDVSIQADSGFNLRTGANDSPFSGTVFLQAAGNISQVGHEGVIEPLEANRIAMISAAAVLFSQVRVNSQVTSDDSTVPNLAIRGGAPVPVSVLPTGEFPTTLIPSSTITDFSPIGFNPAGTEQARDDDSGLNDLTGARIMEPSAIGDGYSIIMKVLGDAKLGVVHDATGVQADLVGITVSDPAGNAYLQTTPDAGGAGAAAAIPEMGNIVFSSLGAPTETVVQMLGGVLTAIAAGTLTIDTDQPGAATGIRTTKLSSSTGTVTSVEGFSTFDGSSNTATNKTGPRMILDAPNENQDAATTGLVFSPEFEQRVTLVAGSRGEDNLILELEWADVESPRDSAPLPPDVAGTIPNPDVTLVPDDVDSMAPQPLLQTSDPALDFRVVTARHNYAEAFIPDNPALPLLPTTLRLYNDPAINLFDQGGARDLNVNDNFVSPRAVAVPTAGYFEITSAELPTVFDPVEPVLVTIVTTVPQARAVVDEIRVAASSSAEVIRFGRVGEDGEFINEPGEEWPVEWEGGSEGDFLNEIREAVENSPSLEGLYRIESQTPRGEQTLDEWVKGDAVEETDQNAEEAAEAAESADEQPPADEASETGDPPSASVAPSVEQVGVKATVPATSAMDYRMQRGASHLMTGQLLVGAAALAVSRWNFRLAARGPIADSEASRDLSRSARRRRAWRRWAPPPADTGSEVAG